MATGDVEQVNEKVKSVPFWFHSIKLRDGVFTPGLKTTAQLEHELKAVQLPDLENKTVLDIGAWDGFFSFESERRGASKVLALDHYVWSLDMPAVMQYFRDCQERGVTPQQYDRVPGLWRPDELPGMRGFNTAREILRSRVESMVADFMEVDFAKLGTFDVVLYLGVLYHMHNPFEALKRLARVTRELAVIETHAIVIPGYEHLVLCEFYETNELGADITTWWGPSENALTGMCRAAGFRRVYSLVVPPAKQTVPVRSFLERIPNSPEPHPEKGKPLHYRAIVHAWK